MTDQRNKMLLNCNKIIFIMKLWKKNYSKNKYDQTWNAI